MIDYEWSCPQKYWLLSLQAADNGRRESRSFDCAQDDKVGAQDDKVGAQDDKVGRSG